MVDKKTNRAASTKKRPKGPTLSTRVSALEEESRKNFEFQQAVIKDLEDFEDALLKTERQLLEVREAVKAVYTELDKNVPKRQWWKQLF